MTEEQSALSGLAKELRADAAYRQTEKVILREYARLGQDPVHATLTGCAASWGMSAWPPGMVVSASLVRLIKDGSTGGG